MRGQSETGLRFRPRSTKPMPTLMKKDQTMSGGRRQSRRVLGCDRTFLHGRFGFFGSMSAAGRAAQRYDSGLGDSLKTQGLRSNCLKMWCPFSAAGEVARRPAVELLAGDEIHPG